MVIFIDALFGLPRKKSSGTSYIQPLYEDLFFLNQVDVDKFINEYPSFKQDNVGVMFYLIFI